MEEIKNNVVKEVNSFKIDIEQFWPGSESVKLSFGEDIEINFYATYVGVEPLTRMVKSLLEIERYECDTFVWYDEPGWIRFSIELVSDNLLSMKITGDENVEPQDILLPYEVYRQGVIDAAIQALKEYGCKGYNENWADGDGALFIGELLAVLTTECSICADENYRSSITTELQILRNVFVNPHNK